MIDKLLITTFCLVLTTVLMMQLILLGLPYFRKIEFDRICHDYVMIMEHSGGLDYQQRQKITSQLTSRGFAVDYINITSMAGYGQPLHFEVHTSWPTYSFDGLFNLNQTSIGFSYQSELPNRYIQTN